MNKMIVIGVLAVFMATCLTPCALITDDTEADDANMVDPSEDVRSIVVVTDQPMTRSFSYDDSIRFQNTFESIGSDDIVVIDGLWIENQNQTTVYDSVKTLIDDGNPILLAADSYDAISTDRIGHSTGFSSSADVYGIMVDPITGTTYCSVYRIQMRWRHSGLRSSGLMTPNRIWFKQEPIMPSVHPQFVRSHRRRTALERPSPNRDIPSMPLTTMRHLS